VPDIGSMLNDLRDFTLNLRAADAQIIEKQRESAFTTDTATMSSTKDSANASSEEEEKHS